MLSPTHIPNVQPYAVASLVSLTLGSFFVTKIIYDRWLKNTNFTLMQVNALIKAMIILLGCNVLNLTILFEGGTKTQLTCLIIGILIGFIVSRFEIILVRRLYSMQEINSTHMYNLKSKKPIKSQINNFSYPYLSTIIVGGFEEILYRGFLTLLCLSLSNYFLSISCLILVTLSFAITHFNFGYIHVFTKFLLGIICLISFILMGSIIISITIHMVFNLLAIKKHGELQYVFN